MMKFHSVICAILETQVYDSFQKSCQKRKSLWLDAVIFSPTL